MLFILFLRGESPTVTAVEAIPLVAAMKPGGGLDSPKSLDRSRTLYDNLEATEVPRGRDVVAGVGDSAPGLLGLAPSGSAMVVEWRPRVETGTVLCGGRRKTVDVAGLPDRRCWNALEGGLMLCQDGAIS